jgi:isoleucyl-tRNA synthetase
LPECKAVLGKADGGKLLAEMTAQGKVTLTLGGEQVELDGEDIQVRLNAKPGWAAAQGSGVVVVLATELTPELVREGYARDLVRLIQDARKELNLEYTDRIEVGVVTESAELKTAIDENRSYVSGETLTAKLDYQTLSGVEGRPSELGEGQIVLYVKKAA